MKRDIKGRFIGGEKIRVSFTCKYCGKKTLVMPHEAKERIYCSLSCKNKAHPNMVNNLPMKYRTKLQRITRQCTWCGNKFVHLITEPKIYCSDKCYYAYTASKRPVFICEVCGKKYTPKDRHTSRQVGASFRTCSNECKFKRKQTGRYISCQYCGVKFYVKHGDLVTKFCSMKCSNTGRKRVKGKAHPKWVEKQNFYCDVCGKVIEFAPGQLNVRKKYKTNKMYCSVACKNIGHSHLMTGKGNTHWLGGIGKLPYHWTFNKRLKEIIKKRDNYMCQICFVKDKKLAIHHIDYDKKNCSPENLITLCDKCHAKTSYNREKWKSFFKNPCPQP